MGFGTRSLLLLLLLLPLPLCLRLIKDKTCFRTASQVISHRRSRRKLDASTKPLVSRRPRIFNARVGPVVVGVEVPLIQGRLEFCGPDV